MIDTQTKKELYLRAAYLIEEFGWTQGNEGMFNGGPYCALGAFYEAAVEAGIAPQKSGEDDFILWSDKYAWLSSAIGFEEKDSLWRWQDRRGRTQSEVVDRLLEMAGIEGAKEKITEKMLVNV